MNMVTLIFHLLIGLCIRRKNKVIGARPTRLVPPAVFIL